jgi:hypothetical protein
MPAQPTHQFLLDDASGRLLGPLRYESASYSLAANATGTLNLTLAYGTGADIRAGQIVEVWRSPASGMALIPVDEFIITAVKSSITPSGARFYSITANDLVWVLGGYANRYANTTWVGAADDYMRLVFRGNLLADGPGDGSTDAAVKRRAVSFAIPMTCEANQSAGPGVKITSPTGQLLSVMQSVAKKAMYPDGYPGIAGRPLFFDLYASARNPLGFTFAVFCDQRGRDLTKNNPVVLSTTAELPQVEVEEDYASEVNAVFYTAGSLKRVKADTARSLRSPFARRESSAGETIDAVAALRDGLPGWSVRGSLVNTDNCVFGRDYWWGDAVLVAVGGLTYPMRLDAVSISVNADGAETRGARFNLIR